MQNEIEVKIMLNKENVTVIEEWLNQQNTLKKEYEMLGNTYFDTPDLFFARKKMGLRVRSKNNQHEITLKMKGNIVGGLHIRPEYNLDLLDNQPDFKRLISTYNLQIENSDLIAEKLAPTFSTDFERKKWLVHFKNSEIEVALDQGLIKNNDGEELICEVEFELKQGELSDLLAFIDTMPRKDGMWLSSLSKAQRGYLVGNTAKIAKEIEKLTACDLSNLNEAELYRLQQQVADFLRSEPENKSLQAIFLQLNHSLESSENYLISQNYLEYNLTEIKRLLGKI